MDLKDIEQQQPKCWGIDGLPQLVTGIGWLLWGGLYLIGIWLLERRSYRVYWAIVTGVVLLWGIAVQLALGKLKQRLTYPRAGYAGMPIGERTFLRSLVGPLLLGVMSLTFVGLRSDLRSFGPLPGLWLDRPCDCRTGNAAGVQAPCGSSVLGDVAGVGSVPGPAAPVSREARGWGCRLLDAGVHGAHRHRAWRALRLRRFLRENPTPAETEA